MADRAITELAGTRHSALESNSSAGLGAIAGSAWRQIVPLSIVFLMACWIFFLDLGKYPLFNPDEGLFAEPAREILDTGEWLTSLLNYVVRYTKPPLLMWGMALSYHVFGVNEFAARFFAATCGALTVAVVYCFLARFSGSRAAVLGSSTLIVAPLFAGTARMSITDMPLTFLLSSSLICFFRAFAERSTPFCWLGYVLVGMAVMTKGPVAVLIPALVLAVQHGLKGDWRDALRFYQPFVGALIVAVISVPWFAVEIWVTGGAYFQAFILRENLQRFSTVVDSHRGGWWYHLLAMLGGYLPWSVFLPQAFTRAFTPYANRAKDSQNKFIAWLSRFKTLSRTEELSLYAALWAIITLAFFTASVSKLLTYTLPAFPALAILVGIELDLILESRALARLLAPFAGLAIIYGAAGLAGCQALTHLRDCPAALPPLLNGFVLFQSLATLLALGLTVSRKPGLAVGLFALLAIGSTSYFGQRAISLVSSQWEGALPDYARYAAATDYPILLYDFRKPGTPFYTRRQVIQPASRKNLEARLSTMPRAYIITKARDRMYFQNLPGCHIVDAKGYVMLVAWTRPPAVTPDPGVIPLRAELSLGN